MQWERGGRRVSARIRRGLQPKTKQKVGGCIPPPQKKKYRQLHKGFGGSNVSRTSFNNLIP